MEGDLFQQKLLEDFSEDIEDTDRNDSYWDQLDLRIATTNRFFSLTGKMRDLLEILQKWVIILWGRCLKLGMLSGPGALRFFKDDDD